MSTFGSRAMARNDVIDILTSEDMENTLLRSRIKFRMNFISGLFSIEILASIYRKYARPLSDKRMSSAGSLEDPEQ